MTDWWFAQSVLAPLSKSFLWALHQKETWGKTKGFQKRSFWTAGLIFSYSPMLHEFSAVRKCDCGNSAAQHLIHQLPLFAQKGPLFICHTLTVMFSAQNVIWVWPLETLTISSPSTLVSCCHRWLPSNLTVAAPLREVAAKNLAHSQRCTWKLPFFFPSL